MLMLHQYVSTKGARRKSIHIAEAVLPSAWVQSLRAWCGFKGFFLLYRYQSQLSKTLMHLLTHIKKSTGMLMKGSNHLRMTDKRNAKSGTVALQEVR